MFPWLASSNYVLLLISQASSLTFLTSELPCNNTLHCFTFLILLSLLLLVQWNIPSNHVLYRVLWHFLVDENSFLKFPLHDQVRKQNSIPVFFIGENRVNNFLVKWKQPFWSEWFFLHENGETTLAIYKVHNCLKYTVVVLIQSRQAVVSMHSDSINS